MGLGHMENMRRKFLLLTPWRSLERIFPRAYGKECSPACTLISAAWDPHEPRRARTSDPQTLWSRYFVTAEVEKARSIYIPLPSASRLPLMSEVASPKNANQNSQTEDRTQEKHTNSQTVLTTVESSISNELLTTFSSIPGINIALQGKPHHKQLSGRV